MDFKIIYTHFSSFIFFSDFDEYEQHGTSMGRLYMHYHLIKDLFTNQFA